MQSKLKFLQNYIDTLKKEQEVDYQKSANIIEKLEKILLDK